MSDKRIITQNELNYIETLYLYCNIEVFLEVHRDCGNASKTIKIKHGLHKREYPEFLGNEIDTHGAYRVMRSYLNDTMFTSDKYLNTAKGREWYRFKNYRIGIMDYDTAKKANQFNCLIQYEQPYMFSIMSNFDLLELPFGGDFNDYHIKRIDFTKIAQHEENYLKNFGYLSSFRGYSFHKGTHYLGDRNNGKVFRMYDKTKELIDNDNSIKIELLSSYFGSIENLYTYELELTRAHLKEKLNIDTLSDYIKIFDYYKNTVGKIRMYPINDLNLKLIKQNNRKRIEAFTLTDFVTFDRPKKKIYEPSMNYAVNKCVKVLDRYVHSMKIPEFNDDGTFNNDFQKIYEELVYKIIQKRVFNPYVDEVNIIYEKSEFLRENQSNELEIEAKKQFTRKYKLIDTSKYKRI